MSLGFVWRSRYRLPSQSSDPFNWIVSELSQPPSREMNSLQTFYCIYIFFRSELCSLLQVSRRSFFRFRLNWANNTAIQAEHETFFTCRCKFIEFFQLSNGRSSPTFTSGWNFQLKLFLEKKSCFANNQNKFSLVFVSPHTRNLILAWAKFKFHWNWVWRMINWNVTAVNLTTLVSPPLLAPIVLEAQKRVQKF